MSLLCSCYKCKQSTPFDRPCEHCGFENPIFPDTVENVARKFLEKHSSSETPAPITPPIQISKPQSAPNTTPNPRQKLGPPFVVYIHPFLGLCAAALLAHTLRVDDFVERLIYYCAAGIALLVDMVLLTVEADRLAQHCAKSPLARILNGLATLPVCMVVLLFGLDEMTVGFALLREGWMGVLWGVKSLVVGLTLTLLGVGFGVYACELLANKVLIGSPRGQRP